MSDLFVNLTAMGQESHNLALFPCTVTSSWIDLDLQVLSKMQLGSPGACISTSLIDKQHL